MKKLILLASFLLTATPMLTSAKPATDKAVAATERKLNNAEAKQLVNRLKEIKAMDLKNMSSVQKQELRKEVKGINETLKQNAGVAIYLSAAAIIIILLLILLL